MDEAATMLVETDSDSEEDQIAQDSYELGLEQFALFGSMTLGLPNTPHTTTLLPHV